MFVLVVERFEGIFIERGSGLEIWELFVERRRSVPHLVLQRLNMSGIGIKMLSDPLRREGRVSLRRSSSHARSFIDSLRNGDWGLFERYRSFSGFSSLSIASSSFFLSIERCPKVPVSVQNPRHPLLCAASSQTLVGKCSNKCKYKYKYKSPTGSKHYNYPS
jgi:hypothetical protein